MEKLRQLIDKYNLSVPRYTSYPPANFFNPQINEGVYIDLVKNSNHTETDKIALYIHIPFCHKICYYCGCNATRSKDGNQIHEYIQAVKKEILMVASLLDKNRKVSQIHYGGGTPNAIDVKYLEELNQLIFDNFNFIDRPEIAIECHPGYLDELHLQRLMNARFNRFSLGIQDFDDQVLENVNRTPAAMPVEEIVQFIRLDNPSNSVNLDFIYGLPGQTVESFNKSISRAISIQPDRLVTFSYAHVPWLKKHQQLLEKKGLLNSDQKLDIFMSSRELLINAGYEPIGLDHYVKPKDELNLALIQNQLHRNFQGYCSKRTTGQVYAFGVSSISQMDNGFVQNTKDIDLYIESINAGRLPVEKGYVLTDEEKLVKEIIENIMCNKVLNLNDVASKFQMSIEQIFKLTKFTEAKLNDFEKDGLLHFKDNVIEISPQGSFFIRNIAASFDPKFETKEQTYSKSV